MNCKISEDLKSLLPSFSVIAYEMEFDNDFDAMNKSKEIKMIYKALENKIIR